MIPDPGLEPEPRRVVEGAQQDVDDLELLAGASIQTSHDESFSATARGFPTDEIGYDDLGAGAIVISPKVMKTIVVPAVRDGPLGEVARVVVDKTERSARAFDASGRLLAFYPATIGSTERPAPTGTLRVVGVANEPDYTYDPARLSYDRGDEKIVVPAGPNNPVGSVWIELSRDSYGIHGSPDPSKIAKTASNGCIRLTNWDAEQLAASVKPGVEVRFI